MIENKNNVCSHSALYDAPASHVSLLRLHCQQDVICQNRRQNQLMLQYAQKPIFSFKQWCFVTFQNCSMVALNSAFFWYFRVAGASAALELTHARRYTLKETIRHEGLFPCRLSQVFHWQPTKRHQASNVAIQLWFNVLTHRSMELMTDRVSWLSDAERIALVALAAAVGAAPGTYSIVKKLNPLGCMPRPSYLLLALFFETCREGGFNVGCLNADRMVDRYYPGADYVAKTMMIGCVSAAFGFMTAVPHALACMLYNNQLPLALTKTGVACLARSGVYRACAVGASFSTAHVVGSAFS